MGVKIPGLPFTRVQLRQHAYTEARRCGLDTNTADAVSHKVLERVILGGESYDRVIKEEIVKHAHP